MPNTKPNIPELRFPEFEGEWEEKKLGDISKEVMYGIGASAKEYDKKNVYVRITDIDEDNRKLLNTYTSPDFIDDKYLLEKNDILLARTGASTGKSYIHNTFDSSLKYYFAGFLIKFKIKSDFSAQFIYQYTLTSFYKYWVKIMSVRSGQPGINSNEYSKLSIFIPSYNEQEKIGDFFSKLDRLIELEEQKLALLVQQKKGYMQKIFSQELRFKDENGNEYPEWEERKFSYFMSKPKDLKTDENIKKSQLLTVKLNGKGVSKANTNRALKMGSTVYYKRFSGQFIYGKQNFFNGAFGIVPEYLDNFYSSGDVPALNLDDNKIINDYFINFISREEYYRRKEAFSAGTGSKRIHEDTLLNFNIDLPVIEEQKQIAKFFNVLDKLIETQSSKVELLKQHKQGLLQKMFV
ncbi:restriction endonuclease subunit S [Staphylococcus canis]|uniref:Restriction endonuclease subunit S n=1 Tax=Staphylococcus canis TaxID=2724942 RepID=A0ABS0TB97_9STAP|nr:restriction endonuclease subunit S [Staphylococcus canis]MBI5976020.1 restriction endonuclease subunit S [Staphylococcus canis]